MSIFRLEPIMKRTDLGLVVAVAILGATLTPLLLGCKPQANSNGGGNTASSNVLWRNELFDYAMDKLLNRMDEYHSAEAQQRTINRLDQWVQIQKPLEGWKPDPVIAGLTEELRSGAEQVLELAQRINTLKQGGDAGAFDTLPGQFRSAGERLEAVAKRLALGDVRQLASQLVTMADQLDAIIAQNQATPDQTVEALRAAFSQFSVEEFGRRGIELMMLARRIDPSVLEFPAMESSVFQEAVWLRNVATWASGEELDDPVKPAIALFDWVVKNVQLVREPQAEGPNPPLRVLQTPLETLLFGRGTGIDRAWLFVLLARQMNIDAALLGLADENNALTRLWGVGVLIEGEIYLLEPVLGLPVPKPGSQKLTDNGMVCEPATLAEAATDDAVLRQFDVLKEGDYTVSAKDVQRVVALVDASPSYLSQRMKMVENRLGGDQKIVLTTDATAQIERFKKCQYVVDGQMWLLPYQTLWQEIRLGAERGQWLNKMLAPFVYPPEMPLLWKARSLYFKGQFTGNPSATMFYQAARRSDFSLDSAEIRAEDKQQWQEIKIDASYWLGLMVAQTGNYRAAEDYLKTRVLMADPGGKWEYGAAYNLARVAEATGDIPTAIKLYQIHLTGPQAQGNLVRARWLMKLTGQTPPSLKADATSKPAEEDQSENGKETATTPESESGDMSAGQESKEPKAEPQTPASQEPAAEKDTPSSDSEKPTEEIKEKATETPVLPKDNPKPDPEANDSPKPNE